MVALAPAGDEAISKCLRDCVWCMMDQPSTPEGEVYVIARMSKQFAVSPDTLEIQHANWGLGYGEMTMVYGFARSSKTKATPDQVVDMRRSGMSWEKIGKEIGVKVDAVASRMNKNAAPKPTPTK